MSLIAAQISSRTHSLSELRQTGTISAIPLSPPTQLPASGLLFWAAKVMLSCSAAIPTHCINTRFLDAAMYQTDTDRDNAYTVMKMNFILLLNLPQNKSPFRSIRHPFRLITEAELNNHTNIIIIIINPLTVRVVGAPQMILQPVFSIFPCSPLPSGTCRTPGLSIPWCCFPLSALSSSPFHCALQDGFGQTWWTGNMTIPLQFASFYNCQVFVWPNCLLDLDMDFLVGNMVFVWDA